MLEREIEDYFIDNLDKIDNDLSLLKRQYVINRHKKKIGIIDILCVQNTNNRYVIIEIKKGDLVARDIGQILAYYNVLKDINLLGSVKKEESKIIFICTGVDPQFLLAYKTLVGIGIDMEIKIIKQDCLGELSLDNYFDDEYGMLILKK